MLLYRLALSLAAPVLAGMALARRVSGKDTGADLAERLGRPLPKGAIWIHGASNGELGSAKRLITALAERSEHPLHITANTQTGRDMVRRWALSGVTASLAPLDHRALLARFLQGGPVLFLNLENEIWPNRLAALHQRGCPVAMVGARLSERSARRWHRLPRLAQAVFGRAQLVSPQDAASRDRLLGLGVAPERLRPVLNLKADAPLPPPPTDAPRFDRATTILAAATHGGEETLLLDAFAQTPSRSLILAPRHPRRAAEIRTLAEARGLTVAQRSMGEAPGGPGTVYLADTMGEMAAWYQAASVTFVGGSLVPKGGHTPFEPARFGSALLHGPHVSNFTEAYGALGRGARQVTDVETLALAFAALPGSPEAEAMAEAASAALADLAQGETLDALVDALLALIP